MSNYYVSNARGSDSTGTGSASNPWKTIGKAIGSSPAITLSGSGDVLYIEPGLYRETLVLSLSPTSSGPLSIVGDVDGAGFRAGGYAGAATGVVEWAAWSDDATQISGNMLQGNSASYVTVSKIKFTLGDGTCINVYGNQTDWTVRDCVFIGCNNNFQAGVYFSNPNPGAAGNFTVDRCKFIGTGYGVRLTLTRAATEYNANVLIRNCWLNCNTGVFIRPTSSGAALASGVTIQQCTFITCATGVDVYQTAVSLSSPLSISGCIFFRGNNGISATSGVTQVADDYNRLTQCNYNNVTPGAHSVSSARLSLNFGDEMLVGDAPRPEGEPSDGSSALAFGTVGTAPTYDLYGKTRPGTPACGALERDDFPTGGPFTGSISCY